MSTMRFALIDASQGQATSSGETTSPSKLRAIAAACEVQLNRDFAATWSDGPFSVRVWVSDGSDLAPDEIAFVIKPALLVPGAVADHQVNSNGIPFAEDAITASDTITGKGNSLSVAASHELLEIAGDPGCNRWADDGIGQEHATEACDPVETDSYPIEVTVDGQAVTVYVSNFVLPDAYFSPGHQGPFDFMTSRGLGPSSAPPGPMRTAPAAGGNYQIVRSSSMGTEQQVTAMGAPTVTVSVSVPFGAKLRRPWRHGSRRQRRGVHEPQKENDHG